LWMSKKTGSTLSIYSFYPGKVIFQGKDALLIKFDFMGSEN